MEHTFNRRTFLQAAAVVTASAMLPADSFAAPNSAFGTLPVDLQTKLIPRLQRSSREIVSAPFASLTSFEVH
ncbi:MAG TPA: twin-arginine translocation signal domain-containing protein, partial [Armatimonadota bacterium]|nr:twin-arginine translocation signal domain-containing protein [Armatimonadota bacterium]